MSEADVERWVAGPTGQAFLEAYDALAARFPHGSCGHDWSSRFGTTHVIDTGPVETGTLPVVLLPGGGATALEWYSVAARLAPERRAFAVDIPGEVGRSRLIDGSMSTREDLLDWLDTVLAAVRAESDTGAVALVGHSYGAMIALAYALSARATGTSAAIDRLVLLDPNSCFAGVWPAYLLHALPLLVAPTRARFTRFIGWESQRTGFLDDASVAGWLDVAARGADDFPTAKTIVPSRPTVEALAELAIPLTVILAGSGRVHDPRTLASAIRHVLPHTVIEEIDGASHHSMPMFPEAAIADAVSAALR